MQAPADQITPKPALTAGATTIAANTLETAQIGATHRVQGVLAPAHAAEWQSWLEDLGFIEGELVTVIRRQAFGGDPMIVRVGTSTYAIKRAEAACIGII